MLILTRKKNQSLRIGDDIVVTIVEVQGDQVRLGIAAPQDVRVLRQELYDAVRDSNTQAAGTMQHLDVLLTLKNNDEKSKKKT